MDKQKYHKLLEEIEFRNNDDNIERLALQLLTLFNELNITSFFKYSKYHEEYTEQIIKNNIFHLSPLNEMNDPAEFAYKEIKFPEGIKMKTLEMLKDTLAQKELETYLQEGEYEKAYHLLKSNIIICSLTTDCFSAPMWAHYADGYKGICIEYDAQELVKYSAGKLGPIIYRNNALSIETTDDIEFLKLLRRILFSKKDYWENEKEWRVAKVVLDRDYSNKSEEEKLEVQNDSNYKFKPKSITVGYKMDLNLRDKLYTLCQTHGIRMYILKENLEGYNLRREIYEREAF